MNKDGFWPGYVAAMASLVQSLLLLTVILAFAIYQMSVLAGKRVDQAVSIVMAEQIVEPLIEKRIRIHGVDVFFSKETWQIDEASRRRIRQEFLSQSSPTGKWLLWVGTDTEDSMKRRSAYLRLMVLRNELMSLGVTGAHIETRILSESEGDALLGQTVHLVPLDGVER
jgi:hypothetical protein